jgi:hypothetical protein
MHRTTWFRLVAVVAACGLYACKSDPKLPPAAGSGGGHKRDSGNDLADASARDSGPGLDEDGGSAAASGLAPGECKNVDAVNFIGEDRPPDGFFNAITSPTDFSVTRVVGTWEDSCVQPTIRLEMSGGSCPRGAPHKLVLWLDAKAIDAGRIMIGQNTLAPEPTPGDLRVRYTRPATVPQAGEYGTCAGVVGTLSMAGALGTAAKTKLQGSFQFELPHCDGGDGGTLAPQSVYGTFNVVLRRGETDVCPAK